MKKIIYATLFFSDMILLLFLSFLVIKFIDKGAGWFTIIMLIAGITASIVILGLLLKNYINLPPDNTNRP